MLKIVKNYNFEGKFARLVINYKLVIKILQCLDNGIELCAVCCVSLLYLYIKLNIHAARGAARPGLLGWGCWDAGGS